MRLSVKALSLTAAILWGAAMFIMTWWLIILGSGGINTIFNKVYPGYSVTPLGSVIGLAWALVDGLICGAIFAWVYNAFVPKEVKTESS